MVGNNIAELMRERGLTQSELASASGVSQSTLSAIINGSTPKASTLSQIAEALHVSVETLERRTPQSAEVCPRCGSRAVSEWLNHGSGRARIRCDFCGADTEEQNSRAKALSVFETFRKAERRATADQPRVLDVSELFDSSLADADGVVPVWFENRGLFIVPSLVRCGLAERELGAVRVLWFGCMSAESYDVSQYGKWWRVWSCKPSEAVSDAVPWEK